MQGNSRFPVGTFDNAGNLYGTTRAGANGWGTVFQMQYSGGNWTLNTLYAFTGSPDAGLPEAGVTVCGNTLYGTTYNGAPVPPAAFSAVGAALFIR
jgi:hypothetical protein